MTPARLPDTTVLSTKVRLTRKFAQSINGVDLSRVRPGEDIELSSRDAEMLIAEGWAVALDTADDRPPRSRRRPKRQASS